MSGKLVASLILLGLLALAAASRLAFASPAAAVLPDPAAVARIKADERNCPGCDLRGADLSNTCVKGGDLTNARFDGAKLAYMCMSDANFTRVSFRDADLSGANLARSNLAGADLTGALLAITSLKGTDLSAAKGLTQAQLDDACADEATKVPVGLIAKTCS